MQYYGRMKNVYIKLIKQLNSFFFYDKIVIGLIQFKIQKIIFINHLIALNHHSLDRFLIIIDTSTFRTFFVKYTSM